MRLFYNFAFASNANFTSEYLFKWNRLRNLDVKSLLCRKRPRLISSLTNLLCFISLLYVFFYNLIWNVSCDKVWYFPLWYRVAEYNLRVSCIVWNSGSLWGLKPGWVHLSSRLAAADSGYILPAASIHGPMTSSFSPPRPPLQDFGGGPSLEKKSRSSPTKSAETQLQGQQEKSRGDAKLLCFNWGCV